MLGFKTQRKTIEVGDVLVDNSCMAAWGSTPRLVLEVLERDPPRDMGFSLYGHYGGATKVRVRAYYKGGKTKEYEMWAGVHVRPIVGTLQEYIDAREALMARRPRWTKEEYDRYNRLRQLTGSKEPTWNYWQVLRFCRDIVDEQARTRCGLTA